MPPRSAREWTGKRSDGEARGKANRLANFDDANMRRSAKAAAEACDKVRQAFEILGDDIPDNLKSAGQLRLDHADASLEQLGRLADPPITKDAIAGRIRRLLQLAEKTEKARRQGPGLIESFMQNTQCLLFEQYGVFVRLGLYYS